MTVKQYAKAFIKQYKIKSLDFDTLSTIINKSGYTLVTFNKYYNNQKVNTLISALSLDIEIVSKKCFTYECDSMRLVFLSDNLSEEEKTIVLLHELGHIYMKHTQNSTINNEITIEQEANDFAHFLSKYIRFYNLLVLISKVTLVLFISGFLIILLMLLGKNINYNSQLNITTTIPNQTIVSTSTTTTTKRTTTSRKTTATTSYIFPVDINTVTFEQLLDIPQIGEVTAQKIIDFRNQQGVITDINSLIKINGIGETTLQLLQQYLYVHANVVPPQTIIITTTQPQSTTTIQTTTIKKIMKKVNINTASANEISQCLLLNLDMAQKIVELRNTITQFTNPLELLYVEGLTKEIYRQIQDYIEV